MIAEVAKYKSTGISWMPQIPSHWKVMRLKFVSDIKFSTVDKHLHKEEKKVRLCNYLDAYKNEYIHADLEFMEASATDNEISKFKLKKGDIILTKDSETFDDIAVPAYVTENIENLICGYHLAQIRADEKIIDSNFLFRGLQSRTINHHFTIAAKGVTRCGLSYDDIASVFIPFPSSVEEQKAIAEYLKTESQKINHFIQSKQHFIELLKEQRQSIITHAVTKGIDENAKMKSSGIAWLGDVPEHWEVRRLKYLAEVGFSTVDKHSYKEEKEVRLCNYLDVYNHEYIKNDFELMKATVSETEIKKFTVCKGDVIITKDSETPEDIAVPTLVVEDMENTVCGYHLAHIKPNREKILSEFLFRLFQSKKINSHFEVASKGVTRYGLSYDDINSVFLPYPVTLKEQHAIINYIRAETKTLDIAIAKAEKEIELMKEYKEAMIVEAVTGKVLFSKD